MYMCFPDQKPDKFTALVDLSGMARVFLAASSGLDELMVVCLEIKPTDRPDSQTNSTRCIID